MDLNRLYRASDLLYKHRDALQEHFFGAARSMFGLGQTITLYDLTNTYFEGVATGVSKAKPGHSKDGLAKEGSDCPLVTLAMALDASGFVRRVQFFAANPQVLASEPTTLKDMLTGLHAAPGHHGGDGCGHRRAGQPDLAAQAGLPLRGGVPAAPAPVRSGPGHRGAVRRRRDDQAASRAHRAKW